MLQIVTFLSAVCLRRGLFLRLLVVSSAESFFGFGAGYFAAVAVRHGLNILVGELVAGPDDIGYGVAYRREHNIDEPQNGLRVVCLSDTLEVCEVLRSLDADPAGGLETEYKHSERAGDGGCELAHEGLNREGDSLGLDAGGEFAELRAVGREHEEHDAENSHGYRAQYRDDDEAFHRVVADEPHDNA